MSRFVQFSKAHFFNKCQPEIRFEQQVDVRSEVVHSECKQRQGQDLNPKTVCHS